MWLTGDQSPAGVLILDPASAAGDALFVAPPSRRDNGEFWTDAASGELWVGRQASLEGRAEALEINCRPLAELPERLARLGEAIVCRGFDASIERQVSGADPVLDAELAAVLSELRLVKDEWEVDQLRAAVDATTLGFCDVAALMLARPGLTPSVMSRRPSRAARGWRATASAITRSPPPERTPAHCTGTATTAR